MKTILKYVIELDLLNCHAKFRGDTISRFRKITFEFAFLVIFEIFPNKNCPFRLRIWPPDVTLNKGTSCRFTVLIIFVSVNPLLKVSDCNCPMKTVTMKTVTLLKSDIFFKTHVLHVYTYSGVFTNIFELNLIQLFAMKKFEKIIEVLCTRM